MPKDIYKASSVKKLDRIAIEQHGYPGLSLMKKAGVAAFNHISARGYETDASRLRILVLCGGGNNGGDGYVVATCALQAGWDVTLVALGAPSSNDAQLVAQQFNEAGGVVSAPLDIAASARFDVVVDALLGVGITGAPREPYAGVIEHANRLQAFKVALDVPSGVDADTGAAHEPNFMADLTITFIALKLGLMTGPALNSVGALVLEDLDVKPAVYETVPACATLLDKPVMPKRVSDSHKGRYGHVVVAGGDNGMLGAVLLAGKAALRCGSGKVHILSTSEHLDRPALFSAELMSAVFKDEPGALLANADAVVVGPGLGTGSWGRQVFDATIKCNVPLVIDADALLLLARSEMRSTTGQWVLTPHAGEAARLLNCSAQDIQQDRLSAVQQIARQYNCLCVLKGAGTLISDAGGKVALCNLGNAGMATAGMGDVLSGMIAAFSTQGLPINQAAAAAVWLHSYTADHWVSEYAMSALLAGDIIEHLPISLKLLADDDPG